MARKDIAITEVGRGFEVRLVQRNDGELKLGEFDYYDVELDIAGCGNVMTISKKCIGRKSGDYWYNNAIEIMQKITFMADSIDMAMHNLMCYSRNLLMDSPKQGYEDKWNAENNRAKMLRKWMHELTAYWGEDSSKTKEIRELFTEYMYDCRGWEE
ncbi:MAG: hypothetical protein NC247_02255 [Ruminococcus flavefaciens]|nr:hypothetical protein [Ruminococcus flavefaciens]